jgi:hypothetical protein
MTYVTRNSLQIMLENADEAKRVQIIGRALLVLFKRQTEAERQVNTTNVHNNIGFTGSDGRSGCISAKSFIKHGTLAPWVVEKWMKRGKTGFSRIVKYHAQLNEEAMLKRDREALAA